YLTARLVARAMTSLRGRMFARLQELSATFYARSQSGDLLQRFTADLEAVERALTFEWSIAVQQALTLAVAVAVLLAVEWRVARGGELWGGSLDAFFELLYWVPCSLQALSAAVLPFLRAAGGMERVRELLHLQPEVADAPVAAPLPAFADEIRFDGVSFGYG